MLAKDALFARLAEGHAAGITVITPNRRLAQTLVGDFDEYQAARGLTVWEAADILPYGAFVERLWEDALYSDIGGKLPLLLTSAQEQAIWEDILRGSDLLSISHTAAQCRDAWRLRHAWRIPAGGGTEDAAAYSVWADSYRKRTEGQTDAARLPDLVAGLLEHARLPRLLVAHAFDIVAPQMREFFGHFALAECRHEPVEGIATKQVFRSAKDEIAQAAAWARARLEDGRQRIGVVVPDLAKRRREVVRVFSRVMQPDYNLPGAAKTPLPFNVSLGAPLSDYPLVDFALCLIQFSFRDIDYGAVSRLLRSPFLAGAQSEMGARARLDAKLRERLGATVALPKLIGSIEHSPILRASLESVFRLRTQAPRQRPGAWARHFSALLDAAGFPGERALDSEEFQTRAKWHETLGELARLDRICAEEAIATAHARLAYLCRETLFQPESSQAPIQVLGVLESAGLRFDALWVSGLTDEAWPMDARPNPFIPVALQKKAGVPQAAAETSAALDRRLTEDWLVAAREVVLSFPAKEQDRDLAPSPLIADIAEGVVVVPEYPRYRDLLFRKKELSTREDPKGPPVARGPVRGGTRVLADQAACPFRAFAKWRLGAEALDAPADGPDAADRGRLLHALMREIWSELKTSDALHAQNLVPVIERAAAAAVDEAGLEGRFADMERVRLVKLADEWLALEKGRKPFEVAFTEHPRTLAIAGLEFSSRIDRMDRLREGEGGHVLIDYKTGSRVTPKDWEPPRPDDPQLPLYAVAAPEALAAVTFAKLRPGDMRFTGFARAKDLVPRVRAALNWDALLADWKREAESLGGAFAAGEAAVDPKRDLKTCLRCDLQTLCRVYEKFNVLEDLEDEEGVD